MKRIIGCIVVLAFFFGANMVYASGKEKIPKSASIKIDKKVNYHPKNDVKINNHPKTDIKNNIHNKTSAKNNVRVKTGDINNKNITISKGGDAKQSQAQYQGQSQYMTDNSTTTNTVQGGDQYTAVVAGGGSGGHGGNANAQVGDVSNTVVFESEDDYIREHIVTAPEETFIPAPNNEPVEEWNMSPIMSMRFMRAGGEEESIEWVKRRCRFNSGSDLPKTDKIITVGVVEKTSDYIGRCNVVAHFDYDIVDVQAALSVIGMNKGANKMKVVDVTARPVAVTYSKNLGTRGGASLLAGDAGQLAGHTGGGTNMGSGEVLMEIEPGMIVEFYQ